MSNINLIDSFQEFKDFKNIDRPTVISVLEEVFRSMLRKKYGTDENCDVIVNPDNGDLEIWRTRKVMEDGFSEDDDLEIELAEAKQLDPDMEVGDDYIEQITLESFGRRAILAARQTLVSKVLELEKDEIFKKYKDRVGEIVTGEVYQVWKKETLILDDEGNELLMPKTEQIPADYFKKGDTVRAVISKVDMLNATPKIIISRIAPEFLQRLFEIEVPEIYDGLVEIKSIAREPGERSKIAVASREPNLDPVGACVGPKGSRVRMVVEGLRNERVDVIQWNEDPAIYVANALSPARVTRVDIDEENNYATVIVPDDQLSLAIGKEGQNARLAARLTGWHIDIKSTSFAGESLFTEPTLIDEVDDDEDGLCAYIGEDGTRCRNHAREGYRYCGIHAEFEDEE